MTKRVIKIPNRVLREEKYVFRKEYKNFGIYQRMTPSGFFVSQDYLISNGDITIQCPSFNNMCIDELLDSIDGFNECGVFGLKVFKKDGFYCIHCGGDRNI